MDRSGLSIAHGVPLAEESGIGALTLSAYLREVVDRFGDNEVAVEWRGAVAERWSYLDLWDRAVEIAQALIASGVGKGTRVGVLMTNRLEFLSSFFGVALAGGTVTTLSTFSTAAELEILLAQSGCSGVLLERQVLKKDFVEMLLEIAPELGSAEPGAILAPRFPHLRFLAATDHPDTVGAIESWSQFLARGRHVPNVMVEACARSAAPADPGALFFSSGSTGRPKGILSAHRGVCLQLWRWCKWNGIDEPVRTWSANGFFWSGNFAIALGCTLSSGGSLILQRTFDADEALVLMERERASFLFAWPHQWAQLVASPNWEGADLSALKYLDPNSPVASHSTVTSLWHEQMAAYGSTETFTLNTVLPVNTPPEVHAGSHGRPCPGNTIKIVAPLTGETLALGQRGEIAIKGPTLMLGYIGIPLDETLDDEGFFRTGDGGYLDAEGRLFWEGRLNDIIKTGGANVSPIEIDDVIRNCPGVKLAQTVGVPDDLLGEVVVTCIVPYEGVSLREADVQAFAKQELASYKVPRRVLFFAEGELETTGSAKVKTRELRQLAAGRMTTPDA